MKPIFSRTKVLSQNTNNSVPLLERTQDLSEPRQDVPDPASHETGTPDDATCLYANIRDEAIRYGEELAYAIIADLRAGELAQLEALWQRIPFYTGVVNTAKAAAKATAQTRPPVTEHDPAVPEYFISTRFLTECADFLLADPHGWERLHLVTGIALEGNRFTLEQMQKVAMSAQSAGGAKADQQALTRALIHLSESGHALHGLFHSHPGQGPAATHPSNIDLPTHKLLEDGGYPVIGAIFVKGLPYSVSYVRFFSTNRPFTITIYGKGVTPVPGEKNVYQIHSPSIPRDVSYETIAGS